jgi:capsular polysaccharide export protein
VRRRFLFLQGPVGPFFRLLGASLRRDGHSVHRLNLNGADLFDWPGGNLFRGHRDSWPGYVRRYAAARKISDLVVFGDCRLWHRLAIESLKAWNPELRVHVMEEGYIRPDWITLEIDGVNGHSRLHDLRGHFANASEAATVPPEPVHTGDSTVVMGRRATLSYLAMFFLGWLFPGYVHHRPQRPHQEAGAWLRKLFMRPANHRAAQRLQTTLIQCEQPYYLLLLQIDADKQVQEHSPVRAMACLLERVIPSFAISASADTKLVVKAHPLDPESHKHAAVAMQLASAWGVSDRLVFLNGGELGTLIDRARGCVTINSTSGISVLHRGKPLHLFGKAVYSGPGLTHTGSIDDFWTTRYMPDPAVYEAFRRVVIARSQINGNFYTRRGMTMAIAEVSRRLGGPSVIHNVDVVSDGKTRERHEEAVSA